MSAGRGIVHSERTPDDLRGVARRSHGLQLWVALPAELEEGPPSFAHTPARDLPERVLDGVRVRVLVGQAFGCASPVATASPTLYLDLLLAPGATLELPALAAEQALYGVDQGFELDAAPVPAFTLAVLPDGALEFRLQPPGAHRSRPRPTGWR